MAAKGLRDNPWTISAYITNIINISLSTGVFPKPWKHALISSLLKKVGLDEAAPANFRPVSNLPFLSKLLEHVVHRQPAGYLNSNKLLPEFQSAYRHGHSTETVVLKVFSDIVDTIDLAKLALLSLLDLSAAFDTVDHSILEKRLSKSFGIVGTALAWITSYLSERSQSILLAGNTTLPRTMRYGVPQGSVLGQLLFTLYTTDTGCIVRIHGLLHHCYADDMQVYFFCRPTDKATLKKRVMACIGDIDRWLACNRL